MGDVTESWPLVLGYAQLGPFADESQLTAVQARLNTYTQQAGLKLGTVYFERTDTAPAILTDLWRQTFTTPWGWKSPITTKRGWLMFPSDLPRVWLACVSEEGHAP